MNDIAPGYVAVGRVLAPSGVGGELKVEPLGGPPDPLVPGRTVSLAGQPRTVQRSRRRGRFLYLKLSGIDHRQAAEAIRGHYLQLPETELDPLAEGEYYRFQLIGLAVRSTEGEALGRIVRVLTTPSNDVFVAEGPLGEVLIPAIDDIVQEIGRAHV